MDTPTLCGRVVKRETPAAVYAPRAPFDMSRPEAKRRLVCNDGCAQRFNPDCRYRAYDAWVFAVALDILSAEARTANRPLPFRLGQKVRHCRRDPRIILRVTAMKFIAREGRASYWLVTAEARDDIGLGWMRAHAHQFTAV